MRLVGMEQLLQRLSMASARSASPDLITRKLSSEYPPARIYAYSTHADARWMYRHARRAVATEAAERMCLAGARLAGRESDSSRRCFRRRIRSVVMVVYR